MGADVKVLIANRGEVAIRIARTLSALDVPSVAIFTAQDVAPLHVVHADAAAEISSPEGYFDIDAILAAAQSHGVTHIHPGYGFLSQSPAFVERCEAAELVFVGPSAQAMRCLGNKRSARALAESLGIATVPGATQIDDVASVRRVAQRLGYPLLLKAAASGGGRGMRAVHDAQQLERAFVAATREARATSDDPRLLVEQLVYPARHIEVQLAADGTCARALGDRECSLQRRYQKVIEEAPAASIDDALRARLFDAAEQLACAARYRGVLTVEFLVTDDHRLYFLEVNPRLQVEHPVTEMTLQLDLVAVQLALAQGMLVADLELQAPRGAAIEARIIAEDPFAQFCPQTGPVLLAEWPAGPFVRVDAGVATGSHMGPHFDALLGKIIAWGASREVARRRLLHALGETNLLGVGHNLALLRRLLSSDGFCRAQTYTHELDAMHLEQAQVPARAKTLLGALHARASRRCTPGAASRSGWPGPWQPAAGS